MCAYVCLRVICGGLVGYVSGVGSVCVCLCESHCALNVCDLVL